MKGYRVPQPFATMLARGVIDTDWRQWAVGYRGLVAIHSAEGKRPAARLMAEEPYRSLFGRETAWQLPYGKILCVARLVECRRFQPGEVSEVNKTFGAYDEGCFGWVFEDVRPVTGDYDYDPKKGLWWMAGDTRRRLEQEYEEAA